MHALVVTLLLATPVSPLYGNPSREPIYREPTFQHERCVGAGAAGAVGAVLGLAVGSALALGAGEIVKASNPASTSASKLFNQVAVPAFAVTGAIAGLAAGTLGAWELTEELADQPPVTR